MYTYNVCTEFVGVVGGGHVHCPSYQCLLGLALQHNRFEFRISRHQFSALFYTEKLNGMRRLYKKVKFRHQAREITHLLNTHANTLL